jgi:hypothetical protein
MRPRLFLRLWCWFSITVIFRLYTGTVRSIIANCMVIYERRTLLNTPSTVLPIRDVLNAFVQSMSKMFAAVVTACTIAIGTLQVLKHK